MLTGLKKFRELPPQVPGGAEGSVGLVPRCAAHLQARTCGGGGGGGQVQGWWPGNAASQR